MGVLHIHNVCVCVCVCVCTHVCVCSVCAHVFTCVCACVFIFCSLPVARRFNKPCKVTHLQTQKHLPASQQNSICHEAICILPSELHSLSFVLNCSLALQ